MHLPTQAQSEHLSSPDSTSFIAQDSLSLFESFTGKDSLSSDLSQDTTTRFVKLSPNALEKTVIYNATDSIRMDLRERKAYLFHEAVVYYDDIELHADYIEIDFKLNELYASGVADENGIIHGSPVLKQGDGIYNAHEIKYNFTTTKAKISNVITTEGEGFIHGEEIKKFDNHSFIKSGKYTTCELGHPHFEIAFTKAKVIPNDKIITGPAYLSFAGIPTFLAIPFGFFPNEKGRSSGLLMPTFGEVASMGFYFRDIGFYFGINDNVDLAITGDIYTRGSWAAKINSNYVFRYKCTGHLSLSYAQNLIGERYTSSFKRSNDFRVRWTHQQDIKSHPSTLFSADINIVSAFYNQYNSSNISDYLSNQYNSNIKFSTNAKGVFFFDAALSYSQSTSTRMVNLDLPDIMMSVNQFYPFRKKSKKGSLKWYDNISMKWSSQMKSQINTYDSALFKPETWENINLAMKHSIPLNIPVKIAKSINWNTSATFTEKWYLQSIDKQYITETDTSGVVTGSVNNLFNRRLSALHELTLSTSLTTKVYFMYQFKKGGLHAIRHVMTPNLSFTYNPNLSGKTAYGSYFNTITGKEVQYSHYENSIYGGVAASSQAIARLSIGNNVEIKVRSRKDTISGTRKVIIFEDLNLSTSYNFIADSLRWSPLSLTGRTTLFRQLYITFRLAFDPYCIGKEGQRINQTELKVNNRLFRFSSSSLDIGLNLRLDKNLFTGKKQSEPPPTSILNEPIPRDNSLGIPSRQADFDNPWSVVLNYTFSYNNQDNLNFYRKSGIDTTNKYTSSILQTLNISGDVSITRKWKIGFSTGYSFTEKEITFTSLDIYRDLHCWEMRFNWIPFGARKGFSFTINVKASILQDLKYNMSRDFRNNF